MFKNFRLLLITWANIQDEDEQKNNTGAPHKSTIAEKGFQSHNLLGASGLTPMGIYRVCGSCIRRKSCTGWDTCQKRASGPFSAQ